jgi:hypothetical protein
MSKTRGLGLHGRPTYNQAKKIVAKFGDERKTALALGVSRITVYRWQYSKPYGTGGLIPGHMVERVQRVARTEGIVLTDKDWMPERIDYQVEGV